MANVGDTVKTNVAIATSSEEKHLFPIGLTIRHVATNKDFDLPLDTRNLRIGESFGSATFNWKIPASAPKGNYKIITAVWEGEKGGIPFGRLDDRIIENAFTIT